MKRIMQSIGGVMRTIGGEMTKTELIAKQQLEIEELKAELESIKAACKEARRHLWRPEQWSTKCPDFPKVAMMGILRARQAIEDI